MRCPDLAGAPSGLWRWWWCWRAVWARLSGGIQGCPASFRIGRAVPVARSLGAVGVVAAAAARRGVPRRGTAVGQGLTPPGARHYSGWHPSDQLRTGTD